MTRTHQLILTNHLKIPTYLHSIKLSETYSKLTAGSQDGSTGRVCPEDMRYSVSTQPRVPDDEGALTPYKAKGGEPVMLVIGKSNE